MLKLLFAKDQNMKIPRWETGTGDGAKVKSTAHLLRARKQCVGRQLLLVLLSTAGDSMPQFVGGQADTVATECKR
jgi:hypothetical protein